MNSKFSKTNLNNIVSQSKSKRECLNNSPSDIKPIEKYLNNEIPITSYKLKKRLLKEGLKKQKCEICNLSEWNDSIIPLELHHINGNNKDNSLSNLQMLCPNCHALTDNYRNRK